MRATEPGDHWFVDHVDIGLDGHMYLVLVVVDAATNLVWAGAQKSKSHDETIAAMMACSDELMLKPKGISGDMYFMEDKFQEMVCTSWHQVNRARAQHSLAKQG